ncbi:MAG TPA: TonB family protein [Candidatus Limnocylindria bacterium]|nr:TonB family protein [Candidatus Limnocylindria bacterium]
MAPLTKDTLEVANSAAESAVSQATTQPKSATGHMRSDALSLEVAVRVHGSKVKEVVLGTTPHTEPFEEQTSTMIIFPQGGVLRMNTAVTVGQMLVLTNLKSRQDAICRVVKVRPNAKLAAYIEVEFTQRQPGYWGVHLPSDADAAPAKVAPSAPTISAGSELKEKTRPAVDISWAPAPPPSVTPQQPVASDSGSNEIKPAYVPPPPPVERFVPAAKPEPSFISIGSQEEVQPAASATAQIESKHEAFIPAPATNSAPVDLPSAASPAGPLESLSMTELRGDDEPAPLVPALVSETSAAEEQALALAASKSENSQSTFGSFAGGNTLAAARSTSPDDFGSRLDSGFGASAPQDARPGVNWLLIAAGAAVLLTVLGGGLYFRSRSTNDRAANTNTPALVHQPTQVPQAPEFSNSVQSPDTNSIAQPPSVSASPTTQMNTANGTPSAVIPNSPSAGKPAAGVALQPVAPAKQVTPSVTPDMMSQSLNSHPTSVQRADAGGADAAPVLDASADSDGNSAALSGISSSPHVPTLAPPAVQPEAPVKIGGEVKEPRLIASTLPVYPLAARQTGVEGDVIVNTTIDKSGSVVGMHVVSGPAILRQAALDALRRWKYEPSMLNGQPVAVEMQVTIKFHR